MIAEKLKQESLKKALFLKILKGRLQIINRKTLQVLAISLIRCKFFLKEVSYSNLIMSPPRGE